MEIVKNDVQGISVKWGKENIQIDITLEQSLEEFRAQIYSVTSVRPEKQKLMFKGKFLKDETFTLSKLGLQIGNQITLMGVAEDKETIAQQIKESKNVFVEDLTPEEKARYYKEVLKEVLPVGLINLGNTCYLNSTMQILNRLPEFKQGVRSVKGQGTGLLPAVQNLFQQIDASGQSFKPKSFLSAVFNAFPQFAEQDDDEEPPFPGMTSDQLKKLKETKSMLHHDHNHGFRQQDADECFQLILGNLESSLPDKGILIEELFGIRLKVDFENNQNLEEKTSGAIEYSKKLSCIIDNQMNPINDLSEGIKLALEETVEKFSEAENKNCQFTKKSLLLNLPKYLIIQEIRFVWREQNTMTSTKAGKAKILRNVAFGKILDIFDFCSADLKQSLLPNRKLEILNDEEKKRKNTEAYEEFKKKHHKEGEDNFKVYKKFKDEQSQIESEEHDLSLWKKHENKLETGNYELVGVITHKGRSSDSGHYVAWVQYKGDSWLKYDDDVVTKVTVEDILNLRGGGDWHISYYLIYRKLELKEQ